MAAILGLEDHVVEQVCGRHRGHCGACKLTTVRDSWSSRVKCAAVEAACEALKEAGARRALMLPVGGAFHSPLMEPARERLAQALESASIQQPKCPIVQNVNATPETDP